MFGTQKKPKVNAGEKQTMNENKQEIYNESH